MNEILKFASVYEAKASLLSDIGHVILDLVGLIPGLGEPVDATNALWYALEGEWLFAALSLVSMIPTIGDVIGKGGKVAAWLTKTLPKGAEIVKYSPIVANKIREIKSMIKANQSLINAVFDKDENNENLKDHIPKMREAMYIFFT
jgi:hypothetical protein